MPKRKGPQQRSRTRGESAHHPVGLLLVVGAACAVLLAVLGVWMQSVSAPPAPAPSPGAAPSSPSGGAQRRERPPVKKLHEFADWAYNHRVGMVGMAPRWSDHGWGMFAREALQPSAILMAVPPWVIISEAHATLPAAANATALVAEVGRDRMPAFLLVYRLLGLLHNVEVREKDAEHWRPYLDILPTPRNRSAFFDVPFAFDPSIISCLPQELRDRVAVTQAELEAIKKGLRSASLWGGSEKAVFTDDEIEWAFGVYHTRAFSMPPSPEISHETAVLIPGGDLMNQDHLEPSALWNLNSTHGMVITVGPRRIAQGEEVRIDYRSGRSVLDIFERYGYVPTKSYPTLPMQVGMKLEGPAPLLSDMATECIPQNLYLDVATGEPSQSLLRCSAVAILPNRPEAAFFLAEKLPVAIRLSITIGAHQHILKVLQRMNGVHAMPSCPDSSFPLLLAARASRMMLKDIAAAGEALQKRIADLTEEWESIPDKIPDAKYHQ
eukprot:Sspe_Gene.96109::Locus_68501_Transcript_1_1_Confidence_1.000_Length_1760::g.96109::m.96109